MREWIAGLGAYLGPVMILAVEILAAVALIMQRVSVGYKSKKHKDWSRGERIYCDMIGASQSEMHLLVRHQDRCLIFATDNIRQELGISTDRLQANFDALTACMDSVSAREFQKKYDGWIRKRPLEVEFFQESADRWMRLTVNRCANDAYDLFIFQDISTEKDKEKELELQLEEARSVSQSKTTFLSRMSHEIRTPMNGLTGIFRLIDSQPHNEIIAGYLEKANSLSDYLLSLINDILDMSRIENGKLELEDRPFDLYDVADQIRSMFQKNVEAAGVAFSVDTSELQNHIVRGDRLRLSQVIINFVSNAVKFTSEGEIRVTFREMMCSEGKVSLMIRVHDTGKGMDPKFVNRIFRPFEQENGDIAKKYGGTGLGMAITDQIVHLMNGEILIDTMPGRGTDFSVYLTLPVAAPEELPQSDILHGQLGEAYTFAGKHILMAEDNELNGDIACAILQEMGAEVDLAVDGQEVIDKFAEKPEGTYDFILMDIQMPVRNGRAAAQMIRMLDRPDALTIPIFALSADAFVEDQRQSIAAGMDGHFAKPVNFEQLQKDIGQIISQRERI